MPNGAAIASRVKRQFGDQFGGRITDADIIEWINTGMREIVQDNELLQVTATTSFVAGQVDYPHPANILNVYAVTLSGRTLRGLDYKEFLTLTQDADSIVDGMPTHYTIWAGNIVFYPKPNTTDEFKLHYLRLPVDITMLSETPELPLPYHQRLVEYCLAQAAEFDADPMQYRSKMQEFQAGVDKLKDNSDWNQRDQYPVISAAPDEYGDGPFDMSWP